MLHVWYNSIGMRRNLNCAALVLMHAFYVIIAVGQSTYQPSNFPSDFVDSWIDGSSGSLHTFREASFADQSGFQSDFRVPSAHTHDLIFTIQLRNMDKLEQILYDVSEPTNAKYGHHLSTQDVVDLTSNKVACDEVTRYLQTAGATIVSKRFSCGSITARGSVRLWERMLDTKFYSISRVSELVQNGTRKSGTAGATFIGTERYSVPLSLDAHIASIQNTIERPSILTRKVHYVAPNPSDHVGKDRFSVKTRIELPYITPGLLSRAYNVSDNTGHPLATQTALQGFDQAFAPEDLKIFQETMYIPVQPIEHFINGAASASVQTSDWCQPRPEICAESNLDYQYLMGMANTPTIYVYNDERNFSEWLLKWVHGKTPLPLIMSMSYNYEEAFITAAEKTAFNDAAIMLGTMGVTILVASGDDGACNPKARQNPSQCAYRPGFPNTSPFVISVGATKVRRRSL